MIDSSPPDRKNQNFANATPTLASDAYTYDNAGNRTALTETLETIAESRPDPIFSDGFENGDFSAWDDNVNDSGDLSVSASALYEGSHGMQVLVDDDEPIYVQDNSPLADSRYRTRFYLHPNSLVMEDYTMMSLLIDRDWTVGVDLAYSEGKYYIIAWTYTDGGAEKATGWKEISDAWHAIEIDWKASDTTAANNGYISLYIDDVLRQTKGSINNDQRRVDDLLLGLPDGALASAAGTLYFDAFASSRTEFLSLLEGGSPAPTATQAVTINTRE